LAAVVGALGALFWPSPARAEGAGAGSTWLPGPARAIARTTSASRDAAVLEYADGPRAQASLGAEPGLLEVVDGPAAWRLGIYAMACLENGTNPRAFPPSELWRGLVGASFALELPRLARHWLAPFADLELAVVVGHESDHATSGFSGGPAQG